MEKLILRHRWALGDTVLLSGLVRDLHAAYPGRFQIKVDTNFTNVWWHNPHLSEFTPDSKTRRVEIEWGAAIGTHSIATVQGKPQRRHILGWYHADFEKRTGIYVPVTQPRADLHLSAEEDGRRVSGRYWVVLSGGKLDMTVKHWHVHRMQQVVDTLRANGIQCVQVGAAHTSHVHPKLVGPLDLLGRTENVRDLWNVIKYADGVICGVTGAMHIAAVFEKPCVVIAGGREEPWFEHYTDQYKAFGEDCPAVRVEHKFLHTMGQLTCCPENKACWKLRIVPLKPEDLTTQKHAICLQPVRPEKTHEVAGCMDLIPVSRVVDSVFAYYTEGIIPPLSQKPLSVGKMVEDVIVVTEGEAVSTEEVMLIREPSVPAKEQKPAQLTHPEELTKAKLAAASDRFKVMDDPIIGGKITVCVLCYGPHVSLAKACLESLFRTVPASRLDVRVTANATEAATLDYLRTLPLTKLYINSENIGKYKVMRTMLYDPSAPLVTNYMLWLDDDTSVVAPNWLPDLCRTVISQHGFGNRLYGVKMTHDFNMYAKNGHNPSRWFTAAAWYRGKLFRLPGSPRRGPRGSCIDFVVGWAWLAHVPSLKDAGVPDARLNHNGGDITIGEQFHQAGFSMVEWNKGKSQLTCPSREQGGRRGYSEQFPWAK